MDATSMAFCDASSSTTSCGTLFVIRSSPLAGQISNEIPICSNNSFLRGEADASMICPISFSSFLMFLSLKSIVSYVPFTLHRYHCAQPERVEKPLLHAKRPLTSVVVDPLQRLAVEL